MINVLLVSRDENSLTELEKALEENGAQTARAVSCSTALSKTKEENYDLIIMNEMLEDKKGLECIKELTSSNPFLNCAAVSSLSKENFHEASEGLGILMQLSEEPDQEDAKKLLEHLNKVLELNKS